MDTLIIILGEINWFKINVSNYTLPEKWVIRRRSVWECAYRKAPRLHHIFQKCRGEKSMISIKQNNACKNNHLQPCNNFTFRVFGYNFDYGKPPSFSHFLFWKIIITWTAVFSRMVGDTLAGKHHKPGTTELGVIGRTGTKWWLKQDTKNNLFALEESLHFCYKKQNQLNYLM